MRTVAYRIRFAREAIGMTQAELAAQMRALAGRLESPELVNVDQSFISKLERNVVRIYAYHIAAISVALGVSADWLLGLTDEIGGSA